jgi:hypothetical protein
MKIKRFFIYLLSLFTLTFVLPANAMAAEIRTDNLTVEETEIVSDDLYLFGDEVTVDGMVDGDLIIAGGSVDFGGTVTGNLVVSGGMLDLSGDVEGSVFVWGGQVEISGSVGRDVVAAGGQVRLTSDAQVDEDVNMAGGQLYIDSMVVDDVRVGGGTVNVTDEVGGDVLAAGGVVNVDEDLVSGEVSINEDYEVDTEEVSAQLASIGNIAITIGLISKVVIWLGMFLVGMVFIWIAPVKTKTIVEKMSSSWSEFMNSVLIGFVAFLPMVVGPFVLMVTVIGIPLSLLVLGALGFMAGFGILWGDMAVGKAVAKELKWKDKKYMKSLAIGRILRVLLCWIPVIGGVYKFVIFLASLGAMVRMKMDFMKKK